MEIPRKKRYYFLKEDDLRTEKKDQAELALIGAGLEERS